jgi:acetolactate synthase-1/2/3 large subunit
MSQDSTHADHVVDVLVSMGYTHCFLVPGGAIMHLVNAVRTRMECVPVVHEVAAVIAAEYFNQVSDGSRACALVTVGPGVTNALTGMAGAYLESHDVLVLSGQVKAADLSRGEVRQRGIQELDGLALAAPVSVAALRVETPISDSELVEAVGSGLRDRKGPVYLEFCLDAQGAPVEVVEVSRDRLVPAVSAEFQAAAETAAADIVEQLEQAQRPVLLLGGGVDHATATACAEGLAELGVPLMTTWNGFDRVADDHPCFAGRPNTWGQRRANLILAESDCVIALGTRLGIQQTGFAWEQWGPREGEGLVIQVDVDDRELTKGHPRVDHAHRADANTVVKILAESSRQELEPWWKHIREVTAAIPLIDPENVTGPGFMSPYELVDQLSGVLESDDVLVPASSGSGQFVPMETFRSKAGQRVITNKGLASMGYGLAAALGAAAAGANRVVLIEGDGSFSQNIQELGTLALHDWPVKIFLLDNDGYASIRTTQRNYFGGAYLGCDAATGLGFPDWGVLADAFGIPHTLIDDRGLESPGAMDLLAAPGPAVFIVKVDPDQTYFPKVTSRVTDDGSMVSNPLHHMSPPLADEVLQTVLPFRHNDVL